MNTEPKISEQQKIIEKQLKKIAELTEQLHNYTIPPIQDDAVLTIEESYYKAIEDLQHESPKGNGVYAILSEDYGKLFLKIMEAVRKQSLKEPALPEATVENHSEYRFFQKLLFYNTNLSAFLVKFYDKEMPLVVKASNFTEAGIIGMCHEILSNNPGYEIEWIESHKTGNRVPFEI